MKGRGVRPGPFFSMAGTGSGDFCSPPSPAEPDGSFGTPPWRGENVLNAYVCHSHRSSRFRKAHPNCSSPSGWAERSEAEGSVENGPPSQEEVSPDEGPAENVPPPQGEVSSPEAMTEGVLRSPISGSRRTVAVSIWPGIQGCHDVVYDGIESDHHIVVPHPKHPETER